MRFATARNTTLALVVFSLSVFAADRAPAQLIDIGGVIDPLPFPGPLPEIDPTLFDVSFDRGDSNSDGKRDISDALFTLTFLFGEGPKPGCAKAADANDDGRIDISDPMMLLNHLFGPVKRLPAPFGACGFDPTPDGLRCIVRGACEPAGCPDPAVVAIEFRLLTVFPDGFNGRVQIRGVVTNTGANFRSGAGQQSVVLLENGKEVARKNFTNLNAGHTMDVVYERAWWTPLEFDPLYTVAIHYAPDISIDANPDNDDCGGGNNRMSRPGQEIDALFP